MSPKILKWVLSTLGSALGWWYGDLVSGLMTAFLCSMLGTGLGIYIAIKISKRM
jgi:hypothetical protein